MDGFAFTSAIALATSVQKAVDNGNYIFMAVIVLMLLIEALKAIFYKRPHMKKYAPQAAALGGGVMGGTFSAMTGGDPLQGAVGGILAGNAASGLYSSALKPLGGAVKKLLRGR